MHKGLRIVSMGLLAIFASAAPAGAAVIYPTNNGFEAPNLGGGSNAYGYANQSGGQGPLNPTPGIPGWTFTGGTGIAANGSAFGVSGADNGNNDGVGGAISTTSAAGQAGLIQGPGTISQTLTGFSTGVASVTFKAEGRNGQNGANPITVTLDGTPLTFNGNTTLAAATIGTGTFQTYTSAPIAVTAGSHTLSFNGIGVTGQDVTTFVDSVSVNNTVPEPGSLALVGLPGLALLSRRRSNRPQSGS